MGIVSKTFLDEINEKQNDHMRDNQSHSTSTVIKWLMAIENKKPSKLIKFGIAEFFPLISAELLEKSINFARSIIEIEGKIISIIKHARKSFLFQDSKV